MPIQSTVQALTDLPSRFPLNATSVIPSWNSLVEIGATDPTADMVLTLPACTAADVGKSILFKRLDATAFTVTVVAPSGETTEITIPRALNVRYGAIRVTAVAVGRSEQTDDLNMAAPVLTVFKGATSTVDGESGLLPAFPAASQNSIVLGDGTLGAGFLGLRVVSASGIYIPTAGTNMILGQIMGGGGGGGGVTATSNLNAACGGAGAGCSMFVSQVNDKIGYPVTIGAGGVGAAGSAGPAGGSSSITINGITYSGAGGAGGSLNAPSASMVCYGPAGAGGTGGIIQYGQQGGDALCIAANTAVSGMGGNSSLGRGGQAVRHNNGSGAFKGNPGLGNGSGGSGAICNASSAQPGGNGAPGIFIIQEYR